MSKNSVQNPFLEVRAGGFHLVIQKAPVRLFSALVAFGCSGLTAWWATR